MIFAKKTVAASVCAFGIAAAGAAFFPATASAASYGGQCGAGYDVINSHDVKGGTVFLTYNGEQNCVVTVRNDPGARKQMGAGVQLSNGKKELNQQEGEFTEFAGPVYLPAKGKCINWGGYIEDDQYVEYDVHCGK
ncbi:spore-associated protein A [Nocardia sp. NPDC024068]|uniref:spore-associated protein A n=1 Tax=Nocardia sp. NPDC024068 TaxID=3157197 RepID=UPI0033D72104